jgi:hypothetical protein
MTKLTKILEDCEHRMRELSVRVYLDETQQFDFAEDTERRVAILRARPQSDLHALQNLSPITPWFVQHFAEIFMPEEEPEDISKMVTEEFLLPAYLESREAERHKRAGKVYATCLSNIENLTGIVGHADEKTVTNVKSLQRIQAQNYFPVSFLGEGASGSCYRIFSPDLGIYRTLKLMDPETVNPKEARLMAKLQGKDLENIVQIYSASENIATFEGEGRYAIVMEYVDGKLLSEIDQLSQEGLIHYSLQLLNGIETLRKNGITHRDLNPRNIKINLRGILKILDFGIASDESFEPKDNRRYGGNHDLVSWALLTYNMATRDHLVLERGDLKTESHAERVYLLKKEMVKNGKLKEEYAGKVYAALKPPLDQAVITALEAPSDEIILNLKSSLLQAKVEAYQENFEKEEREYFIMQMAEHVEGLYTKDPTGISMVNVMPKAIWERHLRDNSSEENIQHILEKCKLFLKPEEYLILEYVLYEKPKQEQFLAQLSPLKNR